MGRFKITRLAITKDETMKHHLIAAAALSRRDNAKAFKNALKKATLPCYSTARR
jgi:hypothetical protein